MIMEHDMKNSEKFIELLDKGIIRMHVLKNYAPDYTNTREEYELQGYIKFINSRRMDELMDCEVSRYRGDEQV